MSLRPLRLGTAFVVVAAAIAVPATIEAEDAASYFSYRFGGSIDEVAVGPDGTIYVAGTTDVPDLPASTATPDPWVDPNHYASDPDPGFVFVAALEPDGRPRWTSYVRNRYYAYDPNVVTGLAIAPDGSAWIAGNSPVDVVNALPTAIGDQSKVDDGWVAKFDASGTLQFASHVLAQWTGIFADIAVTPAGDAVLVGSLAGRDLPGSPSAVSGADAFVMSLRSDGGVNWSRRFASVGYSTFVRLYGGAVAIDPTDATILVTFVGAALRSGTLAVRGLRPPRGTKRPPRGARVWSNYVVRLEPGGGVLAAANLRFLGTESSGSGNPSPTAAVAAQPDGTVLVGGTSSVARLSHGLATVEAAWDYKPLYRSDTTGLSSARISIAPTRRTFVVTTRDSSGGYASPSLLELDDASRKSVPLDAGLGFSAADVAIDARGDLVAVGEGTGVLFNDPSIDARTSGSHVAKVPLDLDRRRRRLDATARGTDTVDLSWPAPGDQVQHYEIERILPIRYFLSTARLPETAVVPDSLLTLSATASSGSVTGLAPGTDYAFRLVEVHASGLRLASYSDATTRPLAPRDVTVTWIGPRQVEVAWDGRGNGDATRYMIQRRFGSGEWSGDSLSYRWGWAGQTETSAHRGVPVSSAPVTFRVRAFARGLPSAWVEAAPLPGARPRSVDDR